MPADSDTNYKFIIHCDLDAFFASVEQRDNPALKGKPVIVGGDIRSRGVVSTCSYEARSYGVKSAMPIARAHRLCPHGIFLPVNMKLYREVSRQVFAILAEYTPVMEKMSIDEAFLDIGACSAPDSPEHIGREIKKRVRAELGLSISVGISYNKFLAKLASELDKPDGFRIIYPEETLALLRPLPVSRLWGVGDKTNRILNDLGLQTIGDIQDLPPGWLEEKLGHAGRLLWELARGIDHRTIEPDRERKSLGREITFPVDITDIAYLHKLIENFAAELCRQLRREKMEAATVTIKLRYSDFKTITRSQTVTPCNSDLTVTQIAVHLLDKSYSGKRALRLLGLSLGNLMPTAGIEQGSLFESQADNSNKNIDILMDQIRERFGKDAIGRASLLIKKDIDK